ncbi:MAG: UPF0158 family protein [Saprospiraceae bacterium]|nr:UPF0158 family protein [Saprospiraceae bacterium]
MAVSLDKLMPILKGIVQSLEAGYVCYVNKLTLEVIDIPEALSHHDEQEYLDVFQHDIDEVTKNESDYFRIEPPSSHEGFKIMEAFVDQLQDAYFQRKLLEVLNARKPFKHFKRLIDDSKYRQEWFDFKAKEIEKLVLDKLDIE